VTSGCQLRASRDDSRVEGRRAPRACGRLATAAGFCQKVIEAAADRSVSHSPALAVAARYPLLRASRNVACRPIYVNCERLHFIRF